MTAASPASGSISTVVIKHVPRDMPKDRAEWTAHQLLLRAGVFTSGNLLVQPLFHVEVPSNHVFVYLGDPEMAQYVIDYFNHNPTFILKPSGVIVDGSAALWNAFLCTSSSDRMGLVTPRWRST